MHSNHAPAFERHALQGTRVAVLTQQPPIAGVICEMRREPYLRTYVVKCDDDRTMYVSACDLAREDDVARVPQYHQAGH